MNILDENLMDSQTQILRGWHIKVQRIGHEVGFGKVVRISHVGMRTWQLHAEKEEEIGWMPTYP